MSIDREKLRSLQFPKRSFSPNVTVDGVGNKVETFVNENDGMLGGSTTEHPSGQIDVEIMARPAMGTLEVK